MSKGNGRIIYLVERRRLMQPAHMALATLFWLPVVPFSLISLPVMASAFMVRENSATSVAMSSAGNGSRASSAETAYANPAGLPKLRGDEIEVGSAVIMPSIHFHGQAQLRGSYISGDDGGDSGAKAVVPNIYGTVHIDDRLVAGLAITAPYGNGMQYDDSWFGRYLGTKAAALSLEINPSIGYQLNDVLSVGVGFVAQYLKLDVGSAIDQSAIFGANLPDGFYRFQAHGWAYGFNAGLLAQVSRDTRVGLTYRSAIDHHINGSLQFQDTLPPLGLMSGQANARARLPATAGVSLTSRLDPDLTFSADVQYSRWSTFKDLTINSQNPSFSIPQDYRNTWMVALGGTFRVSDTWMLKTGIGWDQTPITSGFRSVSLPDTDRYLFGVGASFQLNDQTLMEGAYGHSFALSRPNLNSSVNNTDPLTHAVTVNGKYDMAVDILALSLHYQY